MGIVATPGSPVEVEFQADLTRPVVFQGFAGQEALAQSGQNSKAWLWCSWFSAWGQPGQPVERRPVPFELSELCRHSSPTKGTDGGICSRVAIFKDLGRFSFQRVSGPRGRWPLAGHKHPGGRASGAAVRPKPVSSLTAWKLIRPPAWYL